MVENEQDLYKEYGVIVNASILNDPIVVVSDPREWRKVFQREGRPGSGRNAVFACHLLLCGVVQASFWMT